LFKGFIYRVSVFAHLELYKHFFGEECEVVVIVFAFVLYWGSGQHVGGRV